MAPSNFSRAALAVGLLTSTVSAVFDKNSKSNVAVYWGQGSNQISLSQVCADPSVDIVNIAFVNYFPKTIHEYPGTNHANACENDYYPDPTTGEPSKLLRTCPGVEQAIKDCQSVGKKVLLSLGGGWPLDYSLPTVELANYFADFLIGAYGPVTDAWVNDNKPRPFGTAVVDGFDLDLEAEAWATGSDDLIYKNYDVFSQRIKSSSKMLLSAAPQCVVPDARITPALKAVAFDFIFAQFYNTYQCSAMKGYLDLSTNPTQSTTFTFQAWLDFLKNESASPNAKLFLGLPAGPDGLPVHKEQYLTPSQADFLIRQYKNKPNFGGVMLWEASVSVRNPEYCQSFGYWMKASLEGTFASKHNSNACPVSSSAVQSSSTTVSSSTIASSTPVSSSVVSSSRIVSSSTISSSKIASSSAVSSSKSASSSAVSSSKIASSSKPASSSAVSSSKPASSSTPASSSKPASSTPASSSAASSSKIVSSSAISSSKIASNSAVSSSKAASSSMVSSSKIASSSAVSSSQIASSSAVSSSKPASSTPASSSVASSSRIVSSSAISSSKIASSSVVSSSKIASSSAVSSSKPASSSAISSPKPTSSTPAPSSVASSSKIASGSVISSSRISSTPIVSSSRFSSSTPVSSSVASSSRIASSSAISSSKIAFNSAVSSSKAASSSVVSSSKIASSSAVSSSQIASSSAVSSSKPASSSVVSSSKIASSSAASSSKIASSSAASSSKIASSTPSLSSVVSSSGISSSSVAASSSKIASSSAVSSPVVSPSAKVSSSSVAVSSSVVARSVALSSSLAISSSSTTPSSTVSSSFVASSPITTDSSGYIYPAGSAIVDYPGSYATDASSKKPRSSVASTSEDAYPTDSPDYPVSVRDSVQTTSCSTSSQGPSATSSSVAYSYIVESIKGYGEYPAQSSKDHRQPTPSNAGEEYGSIPAVTTKSEGHSSYPSYPTGTTITVVTTSYVDVCPTGLTTIATVITKTICASCASPTTEAEIPEGWTTSIYVDQTVTITLTKPVHAPTAGQAYPIAAPTLYAVNSPSTPQPSAPVNKEVYPGNSESTIDATNIQVAEYPKNPVKDVPGINYNTAVPLNTLSKVSVPVVYTPAPYPTTPGADLKAPVGAGIGTNAYAPLPTGTGNTVKPSTYAAPQFEGAASRPGMGLTAIFVLFVGILVL